MSKQFTLRGLLAMLLISVAGIASATVSTVDARNNSLGGGTADLTGVVLNAHQTFTITVNPASIWNYGNGQSQYNTNANGNGVFDFGIANPDGTTFLAPIGSLVGQVGTGDFFFVGTSFNGVANAAGQLKLFYVDSDFANNTGSVQANIAAVPEPGSLALMGLGLLALARRRRQA